MMTQLSDIEADPIAARGPAQLTGVYRMPIHLGVAATALLIALIAIGGAGVINAHPPKEAHAVQASASLDIMQMMKDAKHLPEQRFDAF
jgi:hypothetical protein